MDLKCFLNYGNVTWLAQIAFEMKIKERRLNNDSLRLKFLAFAVLQFHESSSNQRPILSNSREIVEKSAPNNMISQFCGFITTT